MRLNATTSALAALVGVAVLAAPAAVAADSTLGSTDTPTFVCREAITVFQTSSPGSTYAVPSDGVITSWRIQGGAASTVRSFKLGRPNASGTSVVASSTPTSIPAGQLTAVGVRIPTQRNDFLGFSLAAGPNTECATPADASYGIVVYEGDAPVGQFPPGVTDTGYKLDVAATLEPDADKDGYGDTTQDACPTQANTQGACADTTAPQTRITSAKAAKLKGKAKKAKVTVAFRAGEPASFTCSVDGAAYKKCNSPLVRKLGAGKHTVKVRATDAAGNADASPAAATVKVKRAKK